MLDFGGWNLIYIGISAVISLGIVSYYLVGWIRKSNNIGAETSIIDLSTNGLEEDLKMRWRFQDGPWMRKNGKKC